MKEDCTCSEVVEHLYELFDGEGEQSTTDVLFAHVKSCPSCTRLTEAERHVRVLVRRSCIEQAPESLRIRVRERLTVMRISGEVSGAAE